ncbi:hypothetical protein [Burkholderia pyrrocinia]|uniref:hypothetical protein n=1 Tax=Burkholderia pyrrocinia TaxID=60550 RepID=UPI00158ABA7A|nr:hypothetical protein [Burkholderia pyrrocinia]
MSDKNTILHLPFRIPRIGPFYGVVTQWFLCRKFKKTGSTARKPLLDKEKSFGLFGGQKGTFLSSKIDANPQELTVLNSDAVSDGRSVVDLKHKIDLRSYFVSASPDSSI